MNTLLILGLIIAMGVLLIVLAPFFFGEGGLLQDASASDNLDDLIARQTAILQRWLKDEAAAQSGEVSPTEWRQRQRYLTSRYVDIARRIAWLTRDQGSVSASSEGGVA